MDRVLTEISKITGRLDDHEEKVLRRLDSQDDALGGIKQDIKASTHLLTGNGNPERGIVVRLDRIEQSGKRRDSLMKLLVGAVISGIAGMLFGFLKLFVLSGGKP